MIRVENLTKRYGRLHAIRDVSFEIDKGEVVGLLGPNGAGKTTTMRILCGCIGATDGRAMVDGKDVLEFPREVKQRIGYLPETPPLYPAMVVRDYVEFAARIKGVKDVAAATDRALEQCWLSDVSKRLIGNLSKGYRQRVGLAQALVHNPDVLVLDEPTSGLDPAQRVEMRNLLRKLAEGERTVVLSTHVLAEVESVCKRVVIINKGQVVAQDTIEALASAQGGTRLRVARPTDEFLLAISRVHGVSAVQEVDGPGRYRILATEAAREHIAAAAVPYGLLELGGDKGLEDVFLNLTANQAKGEA